MRITIDPTLVAKNFSEFAGNSALQESAGLFAKGLPIAEMIQAFAMNRRVLSAFAGFESIYPYGALERGILEKVILLISLRNECQFCVHSHLAITDSLDIPNAGAGDPLDPGHSVRERLALEYAAAVHADSNRVPGELMVRVREAFTDEEIVELTFHIGFINMLNWFNNAVEVRYHGEFKNTSVPVRS